MWSYNQTPPLSEFYHFGIQGMKWGVIRTPEQLGGHRVPKGTVMYRTTANKDEALSGSKYVTYLDADRDKYRGTWSGELAKNQTGDSKSKVYEQQYKLKEDLNIPSREELVGVLKDVMKDPKLRKEAAESYAKQFVDSPYIKEMVANNFFNSFYSKYKRVPETPEEMSKAWEDETVTAGKQICSNLLKEYGNMNADEFTVFSTRSLGAGENVKKVVIKELSKRGYNAIVDEASVGGLNSAPREGIEPMIIFDGEKSFERVEVSQISDRDRKKATKRYNNWSQEVNKPKYATNDW